MVAWVSAPRRRCPLLLLTLLVCLTLLLGDRIFFAAYKAFQRKYSYELTSSNRASLTSGESQDITITKRFVKTTEFDSPVVIRKSSKDDHNVVLPILKAALKTKEPTSAESRTSKVVDALVLNENSQKKFPKVRDFKSSLNFILNHKDTCGKDAGASTPLLIIVTTGLLARQPLIVETSVNTDCEGVTKFDARDALRTTWGGHARDLGAKMIFLLGRTEAQDVQKQVQDENAVYKDIVQADFTDCYINMTLKAVAMMKWVSDHCSKVHFVLKTDDDMFINMDLMLSYLRHMRNATKTIIGTVAEGWAPQRDQRSKWYVSPEQFPGERYPRFTVGAAYPFTGDAARPLYEASLNHTFLYLEDVFTTGIVAQYVAVKRIHQPDMHYTHQMVTYCSFRQMMTSHEHSPDDIKKLWEEVHRFGVVCKPARPASDVSAAIIAKSSTVLQDKK